MPQEQLTIFYSWQSDTPAKVNRNFIERALREALKRLNSNADIEEALRDKTVELDRDTQGVAGSPPIVETILRKIENCAVFIADLSFVGESKNAFKKDPKSSRQFPNPNVLIEYGYSLRCHSHEKIIAIMNTAYGKPTADSLPFDLRHLRWPICYHLTQQSGDQNAQFNNLVESLVEAIGLILKKRTLLPARMEKFVPQSATKNPAIFFDRANDLFGDHAPADVPEGAKAYLRLYPVNAVLPLKSELEAKNIALNGKLEPMGRVSGWNFDRNAFGAMVYEVARHGKMEHFTQLFLSREIWGVDAAVLDAERQRAQLQEWGFPLVINSYIPNSYIEEYYVKALQNYLTLAQLNLKLPLPLRVEAGLTGIRSYAIAISDRQIVGKSLRDAISWTAEILAYETPAWEIIAPFFDRIWDNCGQMRTAQRQAELVRKFANL